MDIVDAPRDEHAGLIAKHCGADAVLAREVGQLLEAAVRAEKGFDAPSASQRDDVIGARIGPYHVLERIGEGGFGSVYMAEQTSPVTRRVAMKIIKLGMDTRQVIARFEAERQALAMMDHPCIARVLDAGATDSGRPYFVMELVKGIPIAQYCDAHNLTTSERLELFSNVCLAVQHAHTKGIIHRDIKPSNVLVTVADGRPLPKVIDFGIAKATGGRLTDKTLFTEFRQLIGTPEYMSPEQAESRGVDVDARTDIYSLGVLLYELLTGSTPFDASRLRSASFEELHRIIREEEPPKPSNRVSRGSGTFKAASQTQTSTAGLPEIARHRRVELSQLVRSLRGELDWIVMKAMDKDRARRYDTASSFAADIGRFLRNEPVQAAPPGATYRTRKLIRRNRVAFSAAAAILCALVLGLGAALVGFSRASRESRDKEKAFLAEAGQRKEAQAARALADTRADEAQRQAYRASIRAAAAALSIGDQANAERSLLAAPESLRGWEWTFLSRAVDQSLPAVTYTDWADPHSSFVSEWFEFATADRPAYIVRRDGTSLPLHLPESLGEPHQFAISPDGECGLVTCRLGTAVVNMSSGRSAAIPTLELQASHQAFSADGTYFAAVALRPRRVVFVDVASGKEIRSLDLPAIRSHSFVALSPDGAEIAVETRDGVTGLLDAKTGKVNWEVEGVQSRFSPDGKRVYVLRRVMTAAPTLVAIDRKLGTEIGRVSLAGTSIMESGAETDRIALSPDGALIAIITNTGSIQLVDTSTFEVIALLSAPGEYRRIAFSADSRKLFAVNVLHEIKVWDSTIANTPLKIDASAGPLAGTISFFTSAISPDTRRAFTGDWGRLMLWDTLTGAPLWSRFHSFEGVRAIAWSHDGRLVAVGGERGTLSIVDPANGDLVRSGRPAGYGEFDAKLLAAVAWSLDGKLVYVGGSSGEVIACDAVTLQPVRTLGRLAGAVSGLAISPDGLAINAISQVAGEAALFSTQGVERWRIPLVLPVAATWSQDGARLAISDKNGVAIFDAVTGAKVLNMETVPGTYISLAFSATSARLIGSRNDGRMQVWSAATGEEFLALESSALFDVAFSPDEIAIVGTGSTPAVRFEQVPPTAEILAKRETLRRALVLISHHAPRMLYASDIADTLKTSEDGSPEVRRTALAWLETVGLHAAALNNAAYMNAASEVPDNLERALRDSELAVNRCPDAFALNTRAIALYRAGKIQESLDMIEDAERAFKASRPSWGTGAPSLEAFRCMALYKLGRIEESHASLKVLRALAQDERFRTSSFTIAFHSEAEKLLAPSMPGNAK